MKIFNQTLVTFLYLFEEDRDDFQLVIYRYNLKPIKPVNKI